METSPPSPSSPSAPSDDQFRQDRRVFYPVAVVGAVIVLTLLIYVSALFGDPQQPVNLQPESPIQQAILRHGLPAILAETGLLVVVSVYAMALDRRNTLRRLNESSRNS